MSESVSLRPRRPLRTVAGCALLLVAALLAQGCASRRPFDPKRDGRYRRIALTFPASPFVWGWMGYHILTESRGPEEIDFAEAVRYQPALEFTTKDGAAADAATRDLLTRYAPVIVQEVNPKAGYDARADEIGAPRPHEKLDGGKKVYVDTDAPSIYAFTSEAVLGGKPHRQLVYTWWYPEHPKVKGGFDPEHGLVEGITVRMTLDDEERPMIYETVHNCGCYHRAYPTAELEAMAQAEFGPPEPGRYTSIRRKMPRRIDLYVPEAIEGDPSQRPVIFTAAGTHMPLAIGHEEHIAPKARVTATREMALQPYERLEEGGPDRLGIFRDDSLVAGSDRPETWMLFPTGIYHAGTPRRRGAQLIHFDQYDWDDPALLEKALRLPSEAL